MKLREKYNTNDYILGKLTCGILSLFKDRKKLEEVRSFLWKDTWNLLELYISKIFDIQKISMTGKFEILKIQVKNNLYKLHNFRCFFN